MLRTTSIVLFSGTLLFLCRDAKLEERRLFNRRFRVVAVLLHLIVLGSGRENHLIADGGVDLARLRCMHRLQKILATRAVAQLDAPLLQLLLDQLQRLEVVSV